MTDPYTIPEICEVCYSKVEDCICPECPTCGWVGAIRCYDSITVDSSGAMITNHGIEIQLDLFEIRELNIMKYDAEAERSYYSSQSWEGADWKYKQAKRNGDKS